MMLWQTLSKPWQAAFEEAWTAYCAGSLPIGAVIAHAETGEVLVRARNRRWEREGYPFIGIHNQEVMHAEVQAILAMNDEEIPRRAGVLYTTMEPCPMCMGMWFMSNMGVVHYASADPYAGSANLLETSWYYRVKGKEAFGPVPLLDTMSLAMVLEVHIRTRVWGNGNYWGGNHYEKRHDERAPQAVTLAKHLAETGELQRMEKENWFVGDVLDRLAGLISEVSASLRGNN